MKEDRKNGNRNQYHIKKRAETESQAKVKQKIDGMTPIYGGFIRTLLESDA